MRTREEIEEAIRVMEVAAAGCQMGGNHFMRLICEAQIGMLQWVLQREPWSSEFQKTIEACHRQDAANKKAQAN